MERPLSAKLYIETKRGMMEQSHQEPEGYE